METPIQDRFRTVEQLLESAVKSLRLKSSPEVYMAGFLAFCEEIQRIMKIAFLGKLYQKSNTSFFYMLCLLCKNAYRELNLERALDEDTGVFPFLFFSLLLHWTRQLFLGIPLFFISDPGNLDV